MDIILKEITKDNYMESMTLKVKSYQNKFVASNVFSIAQSKFYKDWHPTAIYNNNEMVGFLMYGNHDMNEGDGTIWIIRMMIDEKFQQKGFGREAMNKVIELIKNKYDQDELYISFEPENEGAKKLYTSLGFIDTGTFDDDEVVYKLKLS